MLRLSPRIMHAPSRRGSPGSRRATSTSLADALRTLAQSEAPRALCLRSQIQAPARRLRTKRRPPTNTSFPRSRSRAFIARPSSACRLHVCNHGPNTDCSLPSLRGTGVPPLDFPPRPCRAVTGLWRSQSACFCRPPEASTCWAEQELGVRMCIRKLAN